MPVGEVVINKPGVTVDFPNNRFWFPSDHKYHLVESEDYNARVPLVEILAACPFSLPGIRIPS